MLEKMQSLKRCHKDISLLMGEGVLKLAEKTEKIKIKCMKCRTERTSSTATYYANNNPLFSTEKFEVCKICILDHIGEKDSNGHLDRIYLSLAMLDKPFLLDKWESCDGEWSKYITQISSLNQHKGLTFKDSDFGITNKVTHSKNIKLESQTDYSSDEVVELQYFWGKSLENEDLEFLQNEYEKLTNAYESEDSYAMRILFQEASHQRLTIKKNRENNKPVDKELKTLQDLLGSANIKPVQETGANSTDQATFGTLIKKYENDRPIPEPDEAWKDVDGIKIYIQVWFLGHLCKMIGINNDYSRLYDEELAKYTVDSPIYEGDIETDINEGVDNE